MAVGKENYLEAKKQADLVLQSFCFGKIAHRTAPPRPVIEPAGVQGIKILSDHSKQPPEMGVRSGQVAMELNLGHFGLY